MTYEGTQAQPRGNATGATAPGGASGPDLAERASDTAGAAREAASDLAGQTKQQVRHVTDEVGTQARELVDSTRSEIHDQAEARTAKAAEGLRTLSDQIGALAEGRRDEAGRVGELATEARSRVNQLADRLESGGFDGVLDDVRRFARQRPLAFIAVCASAGFVLGRMGKAARASSGNGHGAELYGSTPRRTLPAPVPGEATSVGGVPTVGTGLPASGTGPGATATPAMPGADPAWTAGGR